jgi:hypothetical protein
MQARDQNNINIKAQEINYDTSFIIKTCVNRQIIVFS